MSTPLKSARDEFWTRTEDGQERHVLVPIQTNAQSGAAVVEVTYELLAEMLTDLGWEKVS